MEGAATVEERARAGAVFGRPLGTAVRERPALDSAPVDVAAPAGVVPPALRAVDGKVPPAQARRVMWAAAGVKAVAVSAAGAETARATGASEAAAMAAPAQAGLSAWRAVVAPSAVQTECAPARVEPAARWEEG